MKKLIKVAGILLAIIVVALVAAFFVIRATLPPEKIKAMVSAELTKALGRETTVGGAGFSIWPLGVEVTDVKIVNNPGAGFSADPLLSLPKAVVAIDLTKLLVLQVAVDEISLHGLALNYEVMPDGRTSIDGLGGPADTTAKDTSKLDLSTIELPGTLALKAFRIVDASVIFNDRASGRKIVLGDIDQQVSLDLDRTLENVTTTGDLTISEIAIEDAGLGVRKGNVRIGLHHDLFVNVRQQHLEIRKVEASLQSIVVTVKGSADRFLEDIKVVDVNVASNEMQLAELFKEIPAGINPEIAKVTASGSASFAVTVKGPVTPDALPPLDGFIKLSNIAVSHSDLPAGVSALNGDIRFTANDLSVKPFSLQLAGQPVNVVVEASQLLSPKPLLKQLAVDARIDLGAMFALASKIAPIPAGTDLKGMLTAKLAASGVIDPAHPEGLNVAGSADLAGVVAKTAEIPDAIGLNGNVAFSNTAITTTQAVKIGPSDVTAKVAVKDYLAFVMPRLAAGKKLTADVSVVSGNLELDRLLPPGNADKPEEQAIPMEQWPELPDVIVNLDVQLARTVFRHLTLSDFRMGMRMADNKVALDLNGRLYEGGFSSKVAVDLTDRRSAGVNFGMKVQNVEANDFISNGNDNIEGETMLAKQLRDLDNTIYGKLNLDMQVTTRGLPQTFVNNLTGPVSVSVRQGKLMGSKIASSITSGVTDFEIAGRKVLKDVVKFDANDITFSDLSASLEAKDGKLLVKDFQIDAGGLGKLALDGGIGFDGSLNLGVKNTFTATMSQKLESLVGGAQKAVANLAGKALGGVGASVANGINSVSLYPKDEGGNALFFLGLGGTLTSPKASIDKPRMTSALASSNKNSAAAANPVADLKANVTAKIDNAKAQAQAALDAKKKELEAQAAAKQKELEAQAEAKKKELEAQAEAKKNEVKNNVSNKAKDALKGGLKGFGR